MRRSARCPGLAQGLLGGRRTGCSSWALVPLPDEPRRIERARSHRRGYLEGGREGEARGLSCPRIVYVAKERYLPVIRTRFAPSPTGDLHLGGAWTARVVGRRTLRRSGRGGARLARGGPRSTARRSREHRADRGRPEMAGARLGRRAGRGGPVRAVRAVRARGVVRGGDRGSGAPRAGLCLRLLARGDRAGGERAAPRRRSGRRIRASVARLPPAVR